MTSNKGGNGESFLVKNLAEGESVKAKKIANYFAGAGDDDLPKHPSCISSNLSKVRFRDVRNTMCELPPVMLVDNGASVIVAFKKEPKTC